MGAVRAGAVKVDRFNGNLIEASLLPVSNLVSAGNAPSNGRGTGSGIPSGSVGGVAGGTYQSVHPLPMTPQTGQIAGVVVDKTGAAIPGASVTIANGNYRQTFVTDSNGNYIAVNVPSGAVTITTELPGFKTSRQSLQFDQTGRRVDSVLSVSAVTEAVTVSAQAPGIDAQKQKKDESEAPSLNVQSLQRRASGVLPVRIDVPRAGTAHQFVKPLVVDEEVEVTFRYRRR